MFFVFSVFPGLTWPKSIAAKVSPPSVDVRYILRDIEERIFKQGQSSSREPCLVTRQRPRCLNLFNFQSPLNQQMDPFPYTPRTGNSFSSTTICQKVAHPNSVCNSELIMTSSQWTLLPLPPPSSTPPPPPPPILAGCSKLQLRSSERNHYNYEQDDRHAYTVELPSKGLPFADRTENLNHRAANRGSNRSSATFCILLAVGTGWRGWLEVFEELRMSMGCKIHTTLPQDVAQ
jgi:hypothetical protein